MPERRPWHAPPWDSEGATRDGAYTDDAIDRIAEDHEIPDANELKAALEWAVYIHRDLQRSLERAPKRAVRQAALKRLQSKAKQSTRNRATRTIS